VLGASPIVVGGMVYLTAANDVFAIDGRTGTELWHHTRPETTGDFEDESTHINRGLAVLSNRLFSETDDGHVIALDARSGNVLWDKSLKESFVGYGGVSPPLVVGDKVIVSSADVGKGSFILALDAADGKEVWRHALPPIQDFREALPSKSEAYTKRSPSLMPGAVDPQLNLIFEQTGSRPCDVSTDATTEESQRGGCLFALDVRTGKLEWQSPLPEETPRAPSISDTPVLVDAVRDERSRKLVITRQSNGVLSIFDRVTGHMVSQQNFRSMHIGDADKVVSATQLPPNWNPASYSEQTHTLYFLDLNDCCSGPSKTTQLIAYDPVGEKAIWQKISTDVGHAPSGLLSTSSGLLFFSGEGSSFQAVDASTGNPLWSFPMGQTATGAPVAYAIRDKQFISIAAGDDLFVFGLP
jgi:alcohol dehydrogenase (cytochrome c)